MRWRRQGSVLSDREVPCRLTVGGMIIDGPAIDTTEAAHQTARRASRRTAFETLRQTSRPTTRGGRVLDGTTSEDLSLGGLGATGRAEPMTTVSFFEGTGTASLSATVAERRRFPMGTGFNPEKQEAARGGAGGEPRPPSGLLGSLRLKPHSIRPEPPEVKVAGWTTSLRVADGELMVKVRKGMASHVTDFIPTRTIQKAYGVMSCPRSRSASTWAAASSTCPAQGEGEEEAEG